MILTFMPAMAFAEPGGGSQAEITYYENDPIMMTVSDNYTLSSYGQADVGDETYQLHLTGAETADEDIATADNDGEGSWYLESHAAGKTTVTVTLADDNEKEYETTLDVIVCPSSVYLRTDPVMEGNELLPGSEVTFISETDGDIPEDAVYSWSISGDEDNIASIKALTDDSSKAKLTVGNLPDGVDTASFDVELVITSGSDVIASAKEGYIVKDGIYRLRCNGFNENLAVGESCTVECTLLKITKDAPEGTAVEGAEYSAEGEGSLSAEQGQEANRFIITRNEDTFGRIGFSASLDDENVAFNYCEVSDVDYEISFDEDEYPDLFDNSELPVTAVSDLIGEEGYEVGFSLWIDPNKTYDDEKYIELKNEGSTKYYTVGGENDATITLDGKTIVAANPV